MKFVEFLLIFEFQDGEYVVRRYEVGKIVLPVMENGQWKYKISFMREKNNLEYRTFLEEEIDSAVFFNKLSLHKKN